MSNKNESGLKGNVPPFGSFVNLFGNIMKQASNSDLNQNNDRIVIENLNININIPENISQYHVECLDKIASIFKCKYRGF